MSVPYSILPLGLHIPSQVCFFFPLMLYKPYRPFGYTHLCIPVSFFKSLQMKFLGHTVRLDTLPSYSRKVVVYKHLQYKGA